MSVKINKRLFIFGLGAGEPEEAATTNPYLIVALVKHCLKAGTKNVKVINYP